jgi:hypothetical protein
MAKLGTEKRPGVVRVGTVEKAEEIVAFCQARGWKVIVGVEPDQPQDMSDLDEIIRESEKAARVASHAPTVSPQRSVPLWQWSEVQEMLRRTVDEDRELIERKGSGPGAFQFCF